MSKQYPVISCQGYVKLTVMHELSLAEEVIRIAGTEASRFGASSVSEITIEIGNMSGIETTAFESVLGMLSENSILRNAEIKIIRVKGRGLCDSCDSGYEMNSMTDTCPRCNSFPARIEGGSEFRIVSLIVETE